MVESFWEGGSSWEACEPPLNPFKTPNGDDLTNRLPNKLSRKSKKKLLKKLGLADADENMNQKKQEKMMCYKSPASDLETNLSSKKKKSKLPKRDTHGVDHHASVPRKLRSAMKKRNLESVKKENQEMDAKAIMGPESISKDEKEVAETLYGLADMFTDTNSIDKNTCDPFFSDGKETNNVDSILVVETDFTTKGESIEPTTSFLSSSKPTKLIDEEPLLQDHNQRSLTGLNVSDAHVSTKPTLLNLLSSTKLPHWMGQAVSPTKNASLLSEPLRVRPRKSKRCASHIYICRLIKALQTSKSSPVALLNQTEQRSLEMSQCRLPSDFKPMVAPSKSYQSPKPVQGNMTQLGLELYAPYTTQRQMQQMSPYLASRFQTAYNANQQQQQLQKRLWVAAQYRPPSSSQYSIPRLSLNLTSIQPLHVASSPRYINSVSQEKHRLMAASAAAMSMTHHHNNNPSRTVMNRQEHHCNYYSATSSREDVLLYS